MDSVTVSVTYDQSWIVYPNYLTLRPCDTRPTAYWGLYLLSLSGRNDDQSQALPILHGYFLSRNDLTPIYVFIHVAKIPTIHFCQISKAQVLKNILP